MEQIPGQARTLRVGVSAKFQAVRVRLAELGVPENVRKMMGDKDLIEANLKPMHPNAYIEPVYDYLTRRVVPFLTTFGS